MTRTLITDPARRVAGRRVLDALTRYHFLTLAQLNTLLDHDPKTKYVEKAVRTLKEAGYVRIVGVREKIPDATGRVAPGGVPIVVGLAKKRTARQSKDFRKSSSWLEHSLLVNDVLITCERYGATHLIHDLDLKTYDLPLVPDGYAGFAIGEQVTGVAFEIDRGTEDYDDPRQANWKGKITSWLAFASGNPPPYRSVFPYEALTVGVVVRSGGIGTKPSEKRLRDLLTWTERTLDELGASAWGAFFRFTTADPTTMSPDGFLRGDHWIIPYSYQSVSLLPNV